MFPMGKVLVQFLHPAPQYVGHTSFIHSGKTLLSYYICTVQVLQLVNTYVVNVCTYINFE